MSKGIIDSKSYEFAIRVIILTRKIQEISKEYILSKQLLKSGTAVGALIREAGFAQSNADFINKLSISLKECNESRYWLMLLSDTGIISCEDSKELILMSDEITLLLVASIKKLKSK